MAASVPVDPCEPGERERARWSSAVRSKVFHIRGRSTPAPLRLLIAGLAVAGLAGCGSTKTVTVTETVTTTVTEMTTVVAPAAAPACSGNDLHGSFSEVPGSAGAGSITYMLTLTNMSRGDCYVSGIPGLQLLDAQGHRLPTKAGAAQPGRATAAKIVLSPGKSARADARFSPDVPGPGEPDASGICEPVAHQLDVTIGNGHGTVPIRPPTSVCSHGALSISLLAAA